MSAIGDRHWRILACLYLGGIMSANAMAAKLVNVFGISVTTGALAIPLVYLTTDLVNELYGAPATRALVWMGLGANAVMVAMSIICAAVPASQLGASQAEFDAIFRVVPRVVLASAIAYLTSSMLDVWIFATLRQLTKERYFWLRKNGSTVVSQLVDTVLFVVIAFAWVIPWKTMPAMMLGQYLVKIAAAPLGTPLSYLVLNAVRNKSAA